MSLSPTRLTAVELPYVPTERICIIFKKIDNVSIVMQRELRFAQKTTNNIPKTRNSITTALPITVTITTLRRKPDARMLTLAVTLAITLATTAVIGSFGQTAEATSSTQSTEAIRTNSQSAYSQWVENLDDGTKVYTTFVSSIHDKNIEVFYGKAILYPDGSSYREEGNMVTADYKVFSIDNKLDDASLSTVEVPVRFACTIDASTNVEECFDPNNTVQIQANWVGEGDISDVAYETKDKTDAFKIKYTDLQSFRSATATGSVDGESLGNSIIATMATAKLVSIIHSR